MKNVIHCYMMSWHMGRAHNYHYSGDAGTASFLFQQIARTEDLPARLYFVAPFELLRASGLFSLSSPDLRCPLWLSLRRLHHIIVIMLLLRKLSVTCSLRGRDCLDSSDLP